MRVKTCLADARHGLVGEGGKEVNGTIYETKKSPGQPLLQLRIPSLQRGWGGDWMREKLTKNGIISIFFEDLSGNFVLFWTVGFRYSFGRSFSCKTAHEMWGTNGYMYSDYRDWVRIWPPPPHCLWFCNRPTPIIFTLRAHFGPNKKTGKYR